MLSTESATTCYQQDPKKNLFNMEERRQPKRKNMQGEYLTEVELVGPAHIITGEMKGQKRMK
jgi:hypothetical protein